MASRHADPGRLRELGALKQQLEQDLRRLQELAWQREEDLRRFDENMARWWQEEEESRREVEEARFREEEEGAKRRQEDETRTRWRSEEQVRASKEDAARRNAQQRQAKEQTTAEERRQALAKAWNSYEKRWHILQSMPSLTFRSVPWPISQNVDLPESLLPHLIAEFILSPAHSQTKSRKRRIHSALVRWHTDHFDAKFLHKVVEKDRQAVVEGVGRVVRCLNAMLATEGL